MAENSLIEWTNDTWNPIRGCSRVSEGCVNCYAETIARARPMHPNWARSLRDQCKSAGVPFFFKQMGGRGAKKNWEPIPENLNIREFPT